MSGFSRPGIQYKEGTAAARPAASSSRGVIYIATDTLAVSFSDGTTWYGMSGGGGGSVATDVIWNAKGDLAAGTGADTAARQAVGSDGQVLVADSTQVTGLKWSTLQTLSTATDWNAAGDQIVGTGNDTAGIVAIGATGGYWRVVGGTAAWVPQSAATPVATGATGSVGTAANPPSADDHRHAIGSGSVGSGLTLTSGVLSALLSGLADFSVGELASNMVINNSSTLANATGMLVPVSASATEIWWFLLVMEITALSTTPDFKVQFTVPASTTMRWGGLGGTAGSGGSYSAVTTASSPSASNIESTVVQFGLANLTSGTAFMGKIYGGGTAGNVQLQAAQVTPTAENTTLLAGSCLLAVRIHT